jgi:hypothetical protein
MRTVFHRELDALTTTIAASCALAGWPAGRAVRGATQDPLQVDLGNKSKDVVQSGDPRKAGHMKEYAVSRLMGLSVRGGVAKAAVAGVIVAVLMVGVSVTAHAVPGDGTSRMPAPADSPAGPNDPNRTQAPRTTSGSPPPSHEFPTGPSDPKCSVMPQYPACQGGPNSGPRKPSGPSAPGRGQAPRTPSGSPPGANKFPSGPNDYKCSVMPHYPACEGGPNSGPRKPSGPDGPGRGQTPPTSTVSPPPRTSFPPAPTTTPPTTNPSV